MISGGFFTNVSSCLLVNNGKALKTIVYHYKTSLMKRSLHYLLPVFLLLFLQETQSKAQNYIHRGNLPIDSATVTFEDSTSLTDSSMTAARAIVDTTGAHLWRIGKTVKSFFSIGDTTKAIMTDTSNPYPVNANDWFTLVIRAAYTNPIIYFKHKYQVTAGHDGGIVEASFDGGNTWDNVKGQCNHDGQFGLGIFTDNFYTSGDTLQSGEMAFTGTSSGWQYSGVEFLRALPIANKNTSNCIMNDTILLRFRFVSDSTVDTLDGWIIDDIEMKIDEFDGKASSIANVEKLKVFPNPVQDGIINFPVFTNEKGLVINIYNTIGNKVLTTNYKHQLKLDKYPPGVYFYTVTGGSDYYSGRLIIE